MNNNKKEFDIETKFLNRAIKAGMNIDTLGKVKKEYHLALDVILKLELTNENRTYSEKYREDGTIEASQKKIGDTEVLIRYDTVGYIFDEKIFNKGEMVNYNLYQNGDLIKESKLRKNSEGKLYWETKGYSLVKGHLIFIEERKQLFSNSENVTKLSTFHRNGNLERVWQNAQLVESYDSRGVQKIKKNNNENMTFQEAFQVAILRTQGHYRT